MTGVVELQALFEELEKRAKSDPRMDRYRVVGVGEQGLDGIPSNWFLSDCITHIIVHGGWWPGPWTPMLHSDYDAIELFLNLGDSLNEDARHRQRIRWRAVGSVWQPDVFSTPLSQKRRTSAPLCGASSQAHWILMAFPNEVSLFEAFLVTYDELGFDEDLEEVDPMFVEWIIDPPLGHVLGEPPDPARVRVHDRLVELAADWSTDHPCWLADFMPAMQKGGETWPAQARATVLGVGVNDVETR